MEKDLFNYSLKPASSFHRMSASDAIILSESESHKLTGELYVDVLETLISKQSDITTALDGKHAPAEIYYALYQLEQMGHVIRKDTIEDTLSWNIFDANNKISTIIDSSFFAIRSTSPNYKLSLQQRMKKHHFNIQETIEKDLTVIVLCHDYLETEATEVIKEAFSTGASHCFPVRINDKSLWLGPLITINRKPCWYCLTAALWKNRPVENYLSRRAGKSILPKYSASLITTDFFVTPVIMQLVKKMAYKTSGDDELIAIDLWNMRIEKHKVRIRPQCANCGDPDIYSKQVHSPIQLQRTSRHFISQGGYRTVTPQTTWDRYRHLVSPVTGIISHIDQYKKRNHLIRPVWKTTYFVNPSTTTLSKNEQFVKNSFGKGTTQEQSRASALCEAIERYAFIYTGEEPHVRFSYRKNGETAINPETLQHFSKTQYDNREKLNRLESPQIIPKLFNPYQEIDWTPIRNLTTGKMQYAPLQYCYSLSPTPDNENFFPFSSNGCAAGNCIEEAILQGFLELVERDAAAIWWYNRLIRPQIDLYSFADPYFLDISKHYRSLGWELWVLDVTNDLEIPTVVALAKNEKNGHFVIGLGCHLSMHLAVQRAITEMHQTFDPEFIHDPIWKETDIENPTFLFPDNHGATTADMYQSPTDRTLKDDITDCITRIKHAGLNFLVLNYTRPDIGFPTVKVIVPGLRHFWKQLGPGRLYSVPVKMGWLKKSLHESAMNPIELAI